MSKRRKNGWSKKDKKYLLDHMDDRSTDVANILRKSPSTVRMMKTKLRRELGLDMSDVKPRSPQAKRVMAVRGETPKVEDNSKKETPESKESNKEKRLFLLTNSGLKCGNCGESSTNSSEGKTVVCIKDEAELSKLLNSDMLSIGDKIFEGELKYEVKAKVIHI